MLRHSALKAIIAGALALSISAPAFAGTASSNLALSGTVSANCVVSTTAVAFGTYDTMSAAAKDGTGVINVTCTPGLPWTATASAGTGTGATLSTRKMTSGANVLNYALYTDSARTIIWGDGVAPTATVGNTGTGAVQATTIYGRVPNSQSVPIGSYADTVSVTVTF